MKELSMLEKLLSEDCFDNITMFDEDDREIEFAQVALVPLGDKLYAILAPVTEIEGVADNEAFVFLIDEEEETLDMVTDEAIGEAVFAIYEKMVAEDEENEG